MGWASGSSLAMEIWAGIRELIPEHARPLAAQRIIDAFEDCDCDTIGEAEELVRDSGWEDQYYE